MEKITETKRKYYLEKLQQLTPMDDIFMRRLFKDNTQLTEWMLRILLDKKDLKVVKVTTQSDFKQLTGTRSVTFDVYIELISASLNLKERGFIPPCSTGTR